jgi:hypothetical protein
MEVEIPDAHEDTESHFGVLQRVATAHTVV